MENSMIAALIGILAFGTGYTVRHFMRYFLGMGKRERHISNKLSATFTASLDGIIIIDTMGTVLEFSQSAEQIFGYKRDEVVGKRMADLIVPERYRAAHTAGMKRMRETDEVRILGQRIEIEAVRANGEEFMSELAISRSKDKDSDIFIAYIRDITEKKAAETALKDAKIKAESASEAKSKFLATMSHELRTPFNAVLGILDILGESKLNRDQKNLLSTAKDSSVALLKLMNEVLDYAKITSGSFQLVAKPFTPSQIIKDVRSLFTPLAQEKNVTFHIELDDGAEKAMLGDAGRIKQILINFVSNAVKFTDNGDIFLQLTLRETAEGLTELCYSVRDTGIGIPVQKQKELFKEFYMVDDSETRVNRGTGLGLAISKKLVKFMDGQIGMDSQLGKGSHFWVKIPLTATDLPVENIIEQPPVVSSLEGVHILLAEDNKTNQMVTTRVLKSLDAKVTIAENGQEVLDHLDTDDFDLILMDISMPVMDGMEATRHIRKSDKPYRDIPIVALTAMASTDDTSGFIEEGMNSVLIKPVNKSVFTNMIAKTLNIGKEQSETGLKINVLKELLDGVSPDEFEQFKTQFHDDLTEAVTMLASALKTDDRDTAKRASHILKGLATTFGFSELSQTAALTNTHCKTGQGKEWQMEAELTEKLGQEAISKIDAAFDHIDIDAA